MNLSQREKYLVVGCVYIVVILASVWYLLLPGSREISRLEQANCNLNQEIQQLQQMVPTVADAGQVQQAMEVLNASLPLAPDQVEVMRVLNNTAHQFGLTLKAAANSSKDYAKDTSKDSSKEDKQIGKLTFDVTTRGDFHKILDFLAMLGKDQRVNNVDSLTLTALKRETGAKGEDSPPINVVTPTEATLSKTQQLLQVQEESRETTTEPKRSDTPQSLLLAPGKFELKMQVVFYYYNEQKAASTGVKNTSSGAAVNT